MAAPLVALTEDVEEEEVDVVVERLVVQEQLRQVAQVLAVHLVLLPVHLQRTNQSSSRRHRIHIVRWVPPMASVHI
jgi:hypothetical protein